MTINAVLEDTEDTTTNPKPKSKPNTRKIWGSGFHAGLAEAAANMKIQKEQEKENENLLDLTALARRTLDCAPSGHFIISELCTNMKAAGNTANKRILAGCLNELINKNLITRHGEDKFSVSSVKKAIKAASKAKTKAMAKAKPKPKKPTKINTGPRRKNSPKATNSGSLTSAINKANNLPLGTQYKTKTETKPEPKLKVVTSNKVAVIKAGRTISIHTPKLKQQKKEVTTMPPIKPKKPNIEKITNYITHLRDTLDEMEICVIEMQEEMLKKDIKSEKLILLQGLLKELGE